ncbi:MAG: hypothetical protein ABWX63_02805 [Paeniglutamicibacter terrestris]
MPLADLDRTTEEPAARDVMVNWVRINGFGMMWTAAITFTIFIAISNNSAGGLAKYRMLNSVLLVSFSFVLLTALFSAFAAKCLKLATCSAGMIAVGLAWLFSAPLAALINTGGNLGDTFELIPGDWLWAVVPVVIYALLIVRGKLRSPRNPPVASA